MKIGNVYIDFVYERAYLIGTEQYVYQDILAKIANSAVTIPGDQKIYFMIFGNWEKAIQVPEKVVLLNTYEDGKDGLESIFKCDNFCQNCPVEDCLKRSSAFNMPDIKPIEL